MFAYMLIQHSKFSLHMENIINDYELMWAYILCFQEIYAHIVPKDMILGK